MNKYSAAILTIGDELLIGQISDTNSVWLGRQLNEIGWDVSMKETVGDNIPDITEAMTRMMEKHRVVFVTGGLGPTSDDLTLDAMSAFFGKPLILFPEVKEQIRQFFASRGRELSILHDKQFYLPEGVGILANEVGTAPGMYMKKNETHFFFTPGVPTELYYIYEHHIRPKLETWNSTSIVQSRLFTAGIGETALVENMGEGLNGWPPGLSIAYLPYLGGVRLRLTAKGMNAAENASLISRIEEDLKKRLGQHFISTEYGQWNEIIQNVMVTRNLTLSTAESCTGGFIASEITDLPGSSAYFSGSVVSYANEVKQNVLQVRSETLEDYGAVSSQCAEEMLEGVLTLMKTDIGIAVTGIAGPGGGTVSKPVGTVFISVGNGKSKVTERFYFRSSRKGIVEYTYHNAMYLVYKFLSTL